MLYRFLKSFKKEYISGYTPHESGITLHNIRDKIAHIFAEAQIKLSTISNQNDDPQLASAFYQSISPLVKNKSEIQINSENIPLDINLLSLVFEESRGFTGVNEKAMQALTKSFDQQRKLIEELTKYFLDLSKLII